MQRQIKIRIWNKKSKEWESPAPSFVLGFDGSIVHLYEDDNYSYSQFTGLQDKNGKDIYEGDILKRTYSVFCYKMANGQILEGCEPGNFSIEKTVFNEVKWTGTGFNFGEEIKIGWRQKGPFEVVGNIFENPELIK